MIQTLERIERNLKILFVSPFVITIASIYIIFIIKSESRFHTYVKIVGFFILPLICLFNILLFIPIFINGIMHESKDE